MAKKIKKIPYVDEACLVGERVMWTNLKGERFEGILDEWYFNIASILMDDGTIRKVEC